VIAVFTRYDPALILPAHAAFDVIQCIAINALAAASFCVCITIVMIIGCYRRNAHILCAILVYTFAGKAFVFRCTLNIASSAIPGIS
jgi:hypothetical protein